MLSTVESRYATLKGLIEGKEVSTKDSEKLWLTSRIANTINDFRDKYNLNIKTIQKKTYADKRHGVYLLTEKNERVFDLLSELRELVIEKYRNKPNLLKMYLKDDFAAA